MIRSTIKYPLLFYLQEDLEEVKTLRALVKQESEAGLKKKQDEFMKKKVDEHTTRTTSKAGRKRKRTTKHDQEPEDDDENSILEKFIGEWEEAKKVEDVTKDAKKKAVIAQRSSVTEQHTIDGAHLSQPVFFHAFLSKYAFVQLGLSDPCRFLYERDTKNDSFLKVSERSEGALLL